MVDHVHHLSSSIPWGEKVRVREYSIHAGGPAANAAATLALLGTEVDLLTAFGDDTGALQCRTALTEAGVHLDVAQITPGQTQHVSAVIVVDADRTILMHRNCSLTIDLQKIELDRLGHYSAICCDGQEPELACMLARHGVGIGIPVVVDLEQVGPLATRLLCLPVHVVAPLSILREVTGRRAVQDVLHACLDWGCEVVVATRGERGSVGCAASDSTPIDVPSHPCRIIDTTGAGDAFHAGYVHSLLRGDPLGSRMRFASRVASAKCETPGPRLSSDTLPRWSTRRPSR